MNHEYVPYQGTTKFDSVNNNLLSLSIGITGILLNRTLEEIIMSF